MRKKIADELIVLAGYNPFFVDQANIFRTNILSIGLLSLFQVIFVFLGILSLLQSLNIPFLLLRGFVAAIVAFYGYKLLKQINQFLIKNEGLQYRMQWFVFIAAGYVLISMLLSFMYCLYIFQSEILLQLYDERGLEPIGWIEQIWLKPKAFFQCLFFNQYSSTVLMFSSIICILTAILFILPLYLNYLNKNSLYSIFIENYERIKQRRA